MPTSTITRRHFTQDRPVQPRLNVLPACAILAALILFAAGVVFAVDWQQLSADIALTPEMLQAS